MSLVVPDDVNSALSVGSAFATCSVEWVGSMYSVDIYSIALIDKGVNVGVKALLPAVGTAVGVDLTEDTCSS